uniref:Uncharacterized protein n=1 Tax=Anopheles melas TaxID=34690 RepID=A0A182U4U8_9DIPT
MLLDVCVILKVFASRSIFNSSTMHPSGVEPAIRGQDCGRCQIYSQSGSQYIRTFFLLTHAIFQQKSSMRAALCRHGTIENLLPADPTGFLARQCLPSTSVRSVWPPKKMGRAVLNW